ncbi:aspartic peptidase domain-containing protein [Cladorrhinum sp. PSN259]|nr:aspartic peptidase domain-containing protein [Cladorrhinum sp. PSN259]
MMKVAAFLLQLTLWVATVQAFVLFVPDDQCDPNEHCGSFSIKHEKHSRSEDEKATFDLVSRRNSNDNDGASPYSSVGRAILHLAHKYGLREPSSDVEESADLEHRAYSYGISEPVAATAPNSAGIYQNGPDYSYFIKVRLGSGQVPFYMLLDTGAANSWIMGSECKEDACLMHNMFDASGSKTWQTSNADFSISYGTGSLTGVVGNDTAIFAGRTFDLQFGVANHTAEDFKHFAFDGILGLAMSNSVTGTFMLSLKQKKVFENNMFGISLNRDSDGVNDGQVTFGGVDKAKYTGEITYTNVPEAEKKRGEWTIPMDGAGANGKSANIAGRIAAIDTGTSMIFAPPEDTEAIFKNIPGSVTNSSKGYREYVVPCDTKMPIELTFSGVTYEISSKDWLGPEFENECRARIYGYTLSPNTWLIGDVFLKNVYSVFDGDKMRIGFAKKAASAPKPTPSTTSGAGSESNKPAESSGDGAASGDNKPAKASGGSQLFMSALMGFRSYPDELLRCCAATCYNVVFWLRIPSPYNIFLLFPNLITTNKQQKPPPPLSRQPGQGGLRRDQSFQHQEQEEGLLSTDDYNGNGGGGGGGGLHIPLPTPTNHLTPTTGRDSGSLSPSLRSPRTPRTPNRVRFDLRPTVVHQTSQTRNNTDIYHHDDDDDYDTRTSFDFSSSSSERRGESRAPLLTGITAPSVQVAERIQDSDLENLSRPKSSLPSAFMNMANSIIGAGIIGQPYAFKQAGLLTGTILLVVLTVVVDWTIRLIVINSKLSGATSFQGTVEKCFGRSGLIAISVAQWAFAFGGMVAFGVIVGDSIPHVLSAIWPGVNVDRRVVIGVLTMGVSYPLSLYRDIAMLAKASGFALVSMAIIVGTVLVQSWFVEEKDRGEIKGGLAVGESWDGVISAVGVISFAFVCHHNSLLIYGSLERPTMDRFAKVTHYSTGISMFACLGMALAGFLTFGDKTQGNVLNNFPADNTMVNVARLCFGLNMLTTLPLEAFVCREVMLNYYFPGEPFNLALHLIFTSSLVFSAMVLSLLTCDLGTVFDLVGGTSAAAMAYILPPLCYIKLTTKSWRTYVAWVVVAFGTMVMVMSMLQAIGNIVTGEFCF